MNEKTFNDMKIEAGRVEESMSGALSKIMAFYLGDDSGLSEGDLKIIRAGLDVLNKDTEKHIKAIAEIELFVGGGLND